MLISSKWNSMAISLNNNREEKIMMFVESQHFMLVCMHSSF